jgi:hypothetical protein
MKKNMGSRDRIFRIGLAIIIAILFFTDLISGTLALIMLLVVGILLITSFINFCPLYYPFGISTRKKGEK